jgi:2-haloacid dehalogenase
MRPGDKGRALEAIVFDAYGTLFDVHSVSERCEQLWPGRGAAVSQLWRSKQLEYTWLRSLMRRYENFETITADALRQACAALALRCDDACVAELMQAYRRLETFPEVRAVLAALKGRKRAILSNGSPGMLIALVEASGLAGEFDAVISVEALKIYKPDPRVYQLAVDALGVDAGRIGFVSANCWDACGAQSFGFDAWWINRSGAPADRLGARPAHVAGTLADLPA